MYQILMKWGKKMKKLLNLMIALILVLVVSACGNSAQNSATPSNSESQQNQPANTVQNQGGSSEAKSDFPQKPITIVVPYAAGGGTDATARALAKATEKHLGQTINVVNKTGGGGAVGMAEVANAKPDGYTVLLTTVEITTLPHLGLSPVTYENFKHIAQINFDPGAITVRADSPFKTLEDFLNHAKQNPGAVKVGGSGVGGIWHLVTASVEKATGTKFNYVPFDGAAPAVTALLGGHVDAVAVSPAEVLAQVKAGKLRTLAVLSDERSQALPDVPTFKELGINATPVGPWRGLDVPKDTPDDIVKKLEEAFMKGAQEAEFKTFMENNGLGIVIKDSQGYGQLMKESHEFFGKLIPELGLKK
jgi:tripartite-type tricarboxylate transporter receptor subunit TctC